MLKRLFIVVALITPCLVAVAHAAENDPGTKNPSHPVEVNKFDVSSQEQSLIVKNSETGLHGSYITTHARCDGCHGFDSRGDGSFVNLIELTKASDYSCDWCHGVGSASSYYIAMDNDDEDSIEFDTGHSHGFGLPSGKWRAPNDTYPAFAPRYSWGGLSCFDCHSAHANPGSTLGHTADGDPIFGVLDPGFTSTKTSSQPGKTSIYTAGRWILKKNPDPEFDEELGEEIADSYSGDFSLLVPYPVNKVAIDWDYPLTENPVQLSASGVPCERVSSVNEICVDCHDGNGGLHDTISLVYSEEIAVRGEIGDNSYIEAYGHDSQPGKCSGQTVFNPEDGRNDGPSCRSCHRGAGDCELCHVAGDRSALRRPRDAYAMDPKIVEAKEAATGDGLQYLPGSFVLDNFKLKHYANWDPTFKSADIACSDECINIGLSWPHRTLAWKMLKNELFGIDLDGREVRPGERREILARQLSLELQPVQDLDAVCLDCHNPTVWRPGAREAFIRGLP